MKFGLYPFYTRMQANFQLHEGPYPDLATVRQFGVVTIKTDPVPITTRPVAFVFNIDKSESMSDNIRRNKTKLDFVKETMTNMFNYMATLDCEIYAEINSFNNEFTTDLPLVRVDSNHLNNLLDKTAQLCATRNTNIETAFKCVDKRIKTHKTKNPEMEVIHIFLSDGEATSGNTSSKHLQTLINTSYSNIMIGYGAEHCASLLNRCATGGSYSAYLFVNDFEQTYGVYSEILNAVLYPAVENVEIQCNEGVIYDGISGEWKSSITIPSMSGGVEFTYYTDRAPGVQIKYRTGLLTTEFITSTVIPSADVTPHIYRQLTQYTIFSSDRMRKKDEVHRVFEAIRAYMEKTQETVFMRRLCDDLWMIYQTMADPYDGNTYRLSLLNSQTRQVSYRINNLPTDSNDLEYESSDINYTQEYASPSLRTIQRCLTTPMSTDETPNII